MRQDAQKNVISEMIATVEAVRERRTKSNRFFERAKVAVDRSRALGGSVSSPVRSHAH